MKAKHVLMSIICSMLWFAAFGTETEPNDTKAQANKLTLNGSNSGAITPGGDVDWWKITTNNDGMLSLTLTSNGIYLSFQLFDFNGTTAVNSVVNYVSGTGTQNTNGLAKGTYYVKVYATDAGNQPVYTISNSLTVPTEGNDGEPNGSSSQAVTLAQNNSLTGHVGYYYNLKRDTVDWYKVTTNADGQLDLKLTSGNGHYLSLYLYDNNATTQLGGWNYISGTSTLSTNGLAAGTYYFKIYCTDYTYDFAPYTIKDSLILTPVANDAEPNGTKSLALNINIGETKTGHAGYYYNLKRDTADWYKVTTVADGQLNLTLTSNNGAYLSLYLFDNNGTTLLNGWNYISTTNTLSINGLAAGTYYFKIYCTDYNTAFCPYTITANLTAAAGINDAEPNGSKAQAVIFAQGTTLTGHCGFYYNVQRDTVDWYSITTNADGKLDITLANTGGQYLSMVLYDNNGTTIIQIVNYWINTNTLVTDGLKAGTYYLKVYCTNYTGEFSTYTLSNALYTYAYTPDAEPNNFAAQARTMPANGTVNGHINFYYNGLYDQPDWWKINYTGSGALRIKVSEANSLGCNCQKYFSFGIYKDTASTALYYTNYNLNNLTVDLNSLAPAYYYVRITSTNPNEFFTYALTDSFIQTNCAAVTITPAATVGGNCTNSSITYQCNGGHGPYSVQLFRFGVALGAPIISNGSGAVTFSALGSGIYYATCYADGASGTCFTQSANSSIAPKPGGVSTTNITSTSAILNWTILPCAKYYSVQYRQQGASAWTKKKTNGNVGNYTVTGLSGGKTYEWKVAMVDTGNKQTVTGKYSKVVTFATPARMGETADHPTLNGVDVYPNPAESNISIRFENTSAGLVTLRLFDVQGQVTMTKTVTAGEGVFTEHLNLAPLSAGVYSLQVILSDGTVYCRFIVKQ